MVIYLAFEQNKTCHYTQNMNVYIVITVLHCIINHLKENLQLLYSRETKPWSISLTTYSGSIGLNVLRDIKTKAQFHLRDGERLSRTHHEAHHVDAPDDAPPAPWCLQQSVRPTFVHRAAVQDSTMDAADSAALRPRRKRRTATHRSAHEDWANRDIPSRAGAPCLQPGAGELNRPGMKHLHTRGICAKEWLSKERPEG